MTILPAQDCRAETHIPVLVIGAGACGLAAALAARDAGTEVVLLERNTIPHGNTSMSQGTICAAGTLSQTRSGITDSAETFLADMLHQTNGTADPNLARLIATASGPTLDWLIERHRVPLAVNPDWRGFGHSQPRMHFTPSRTGAELHGALMRAAESAGADLITSARVVELFAEENGRVVGVRISRPDGGTEDIGCSALILASGGFGANAAMVKRYVPAMAGVRYFGWEGLDGAGIEWGMELGAATADMGAVQNFGALMEPSGLLLSFEAFGEGCIQVGIDGRRFSNEIEDISGQGDRVAQLPERLTWILFDMRIHDRLSRLPEFRQAIELGAIRWAGSVEKLASVTGLPLPQLRETLDEAGQFAGRDLPDRFGRRLPLATKYSAPYCAIKAGCALFHTLGGLTIDHDARVLRADGTPLPNLFAGGGTARNLAGASSSGYLPGSGLCVAVTLGSLAGKAAARLAATAPHRSNTTSGEAGTAEHSSTCEGASPSVSTI